MKPSEIQLGKCYGNGKGKVRRVDKVISTALGPYDIMYSIPGQRGYFGPTLASTFARWATHEVPCPEEG